MEKHSGVSLLPETLSKTSGATVWIFVILISDELHDNNMPLILDN